MRWSLFAGLLLCALLIAAKASRVEGQQQIEPKKVAVLVGINRYQKRGLDNKPLQFAERDVTDLDKLLKAEGFAVRPLLGNAATKAAIETAIREQLRNVNATDIVLLGFAGHGQQLPLKDKDGNLRRDGAGRTLEDACFCPVDAYLGDADTMISLTALLETLDRRGGINLMLVDACRDNPDPGRGARSISGNELNGRLPANTAVLFSCSAGQQALETIDAGGGHGVFFHHVLEGLRGKARDAETGQVAWDDLVTYVQRNVNARAMQWFPDRARTAIQGRLQTPHQLSNLVEIPVLARRPLAPAQPVVPTRLNVNSVPSKVAPATRPQPAPPPVTLPRPETFIGTRVGQERSDNLLKLTLCWCPPGRFTMGSPPTEFYRENNENQVAVTFRSGFWLGKYEVTQDEYRRLTGASPSHFSATGAGKSEVHGMNTSRFPVEQVSWDEAVEFCKQLTAQERKAGRLASGWVYRLPSEPQWEYACRAGTTVATPFGEIITSNVANFDGRFPSNQAPNGPFLERTTAVGSYRANGWGFHDMIGNVAEWCQDSYVNRLPGGTDPLVEVPGIDQRALRGGEWAGYPVTSRSATRHKFPMAPGINSSGFRVALVRAE